MKFMLKCTKFLQDSGKFPFMKNWSSSEIKNINIAWLTVLFPFVDCTGTSTFKQQLYKLFFIRNKEIKPGY